MIQSSRAHLGSVWTSSPSERALSFPSTCSAPQFKAKSQVMPSLRGPMISQISWRDDHRVGFYGVPSESHTATRLSTKMLGITGIPSRDKITTFPPSSRCLAEGIQIRCIRMMAYSEGLDRYLFTTQQCACLETQDNVKFQLDRPPY
jgi:hypothetical protein